MFKRSIDNQTLTDGSRYFEASKLLHVTTQGSGATSVLGMLVGHRCYESYPNFAVHLISLRGLPNRIKSYLIEKKPPL